MGIGIAANTAIFTLVDALLLRKLPIRNPEQLVRLVDHQPALPDGSSFEYAFWRFLRSHSTSFSDVIGQAETTTTITVGSETEFLNVGIVTENYFSCLGLNVRLDAADAVVLSDSYWRKRFHGDADVVGRTIRLNGHPFTIAGVTSPEFRGDTVELNPDVRIPAQSATLMTDQPGPLEEGFFPYELLARLRPGVGIERAQFESASLRKNWVREFAREYSQRHPGESIGSDADLAGELRVQSIERGVSVLREQFAAPLWLLMAGVMLVLLMVCSNVTALLLERATARERETAVRLAMGASRGRLVRQWLTETLFLSLPGGLSGIGLAKVSLPLVAAMIPPIRDRSGRLLAVDPHVVLNGRVLVFSILICLLAAILAGLAPAWRVGRQDLTIAMRSVRASSRIESTITTLQIALCTLLLVEAFLLTRTLTSMRSKDFGFDRDHMVAFTLRREHASKDAKSQTLRTLLIHAARQLPGVRSAAFAQLGLLRGTSMRTTIGLPAQPIPETEFMNSSTNAVSPEYFETMGIPLVAGRSLLAIDSPGPGTIPVVVNQTLANHFFPGQNPIGQRLESATPSKAQLRIVGVARDIQYRTLREPILPTFYSNGIETASVLHVRTWGDPASLIAPVRKMIPQLAPGWQVQEINLSIEEVERSIWRERIVAEVSIAFAAAAALLAAVGLYGTLTYYIARNERSIGVRVAIGASPMDVIALLAGRVARLIGAGMLLGLAAAFVFKESVRPLLFGVSPIDPNAIASVVVLMLLVTGFALALPIWRASGIDPALSLRQD